MTIEPLRPFLSNSCVLLHFPVSSKTYTAATQSLGMGVGGWGMDDRPSLDPVLTELWSGALCERLQREVSLKRASAVADATFAGPAFGDTLTGEVPPMRFRHFAIAFALFLTLAPAQDQPKRTPDVPYVPTPDAVVQSM